MKWVFLKVPVLVLSSEISVVYRKRSFAESCNKPLSLSPIIIVSNKALLIIGKAYAAWLYKNEVLIKQN